MQNALEMTREQPYFVAEYDAALNELDAAKDDWARLSIVDISARKKDMVPGTPAAGEEWISGPHATLSGVHSLISTKTRPMP